MTLNIALQPKQQQKSKNDLLLEAKQTSSEPELNTDLYSEGYFVGYIGAEPTRPEDDSYWSGYQLGCREYWGIELGVEIPSQI